MRWLLKLSFDQIHHLINHTPIFDGHLMNIYMISRITPRSNASSYFIFLGAFYSSIFFFFGDKFDIKYIFMEPFIN
jgi:hypothetical protein